MYIKTFFYNIDQNDRLEKRSISQYTYENNVKTNGVPKFTYILPKNTINIGANVMQINKKTGTVNENMGYSSIVDQYSISSLNKSESSTEKYGYYQEYLVKNSLNENETNYMNNVFNYYEQRPYKNPSFQIGITNLFLNIFIWSVIELLRRMTLFMRY